MNDFLVLLILGYLLGSISPGYFFGRLVKGIDIRKYGIKNAGATNTYLTVGPAYGIITGIVDGLKSVIVYFAALYGISGLISPVGPDVAIFAGLAAVFGQIFPFYINFRGGMGVASLLGLNFVTLFFTRSFFALGLFVGTVIYFLLMTNRPGVRETLSQTPLRRILKLAALILPLVYLVLSQAVLVWIVGALLFISVIFDFFRLISPSFNRAYLDLKYLAKQKESRSFSVFTLFLSSALLVFMFFPKEIAVASIVFFILGDVFAPIIRKWFWPKVIFDDKTLGGASLIFTLSFVAGLFLNSLTPLILPLKMIMIGAAATVVFDLLSFWVDDNFLVPLGTAAILTLLV